MVTCRLPFLRINTIWMTATTQKYISVAMRVTPCNLSSKMAAFIKRHPSNEPAFWISHHQKFIKLILDRYCLTVQKTNHPPTYNICPLSNEPHTYCISATFFSYQTSAQKSCPKKLKSKQSYKSLSNATNPAAELLAA